MSTWCTGSRCCREKRRKTPAQRALPKYADLADMLATQKESRSRQAFPHPRFESFYAKWTPSELRELARGLRMLSV